jgi:tetraacyldisaccharide 4'-kinase
VLIPFSWLYLLAHKLNTLLQGKPYKSSIPVICVGNAIAGGSGKTPSVIALIQLIKENNLANNPVILTRGYGSKIKQATLIDTNKHNQNDIGDEALLLAQYAQVIISPQRAEGAKLAEKIKADLIIMDDGLQNNQLHKDLNFLVVDRQIDFGNNRLLPAGPLREPLKHVLDKVQAIICIGRPFHSDLLVFEATVTPKNIPNTDQNYVAFAGLGYPEKFKNTLLDHNINLVGWRAFPDHYQYTKNDEDDLKDLALNNKTNLITTEKDYVRLSPEFQKDVLHFPIQLMFKKPNDILSLMKTHIKKSA